MWDPVDDEFRYRVLNGEGTSTDAERLLRELESQLIQGRTSSNIKFHWKKKAHRMGLLINVILGINELRLRN